MSINTMGFKVSDKITCCSTVSSEFDQAQFQFLQGPVVHFKCINLEGWPIINVSPNIPKILEYTVNEFCSETVKYSELISKRDIKQVLSELEQAQNKTLDELDLKPYRIKHKNGSERWVKDHTKIHRNSKKEITHYSRYIFDIHEQVINRQELEAVYQRYETAKKLTKIGHWHMDLNLDKHCWSPEIYKILDLHPEQIEPSLKAFMNRVHPDDRERISQDYFDSLPTHAPFETEYRLLMKDGSIKHVHDNYETLYDKHNKAICTVGTLRDVTLTNEAKNSLSSAYDELKLKLDNRSTDIRILGRQVVAGIRKQALDKERLQKSEKKYRMLMEDASDAIFVVDGESGIILDSNDKGRMLTGRPVKELKGMHHLQLHPEREAKKYLTIFQTHYNEGKGYETDVVVLNKDGHEVPVEIRTSVIKLGKKKIVQGIYRDITGKRRREQALLDSESRFKTVFNSTLDGMLLADPVTDQFVECNDTVCQMLGYKRSELLNLKIRDLHRKEDYAKILTEKEKFNRGEINLATTMTMLKSDGGAFQADLNITPVKLNDRTYMLGVIRDITQQKLAEKNLEAEKNRLRILIEESPAIICFKDAKGRWLEANRSLLKLFGLLGTDYKGKSNAELISLAPQQIRDVFRYCSEIDKEVWEQGKQIQKEIIIPKGNNNSQTIDFTKTPLFNANKEPEALLVIGHDISDLKRDEQTRLMKHEQQKDALVREVHHRIKNHLHDLMGLLRLRTRDHAEIANVINEAIGQIETIAVVYGLQCKNSSNQFFLDQMFDAIIDSISSMSQIPLSILKKGEICFCEIDRDKAVPLALVINELVVNAIKHYKKHVKNKEVKIEYRCISEGIELEIVNEGRLPQTFDFSKGTGLGTGLELVKVMLPTDGTKLTILQHENSIATKLEIRQPIIVG